MSILLALAISLQDGTAEESYRRLEETLQKAKSLSLKYTLDLAMGGQQISASGTLSLKEGNRLKIVLRTKGGVGPNQELSVVSDGSTVRTQPKPPGWTEAEWAVPKTQNESVIVALLRVGCLDLHWLPHRIHDSENDPKRALVVSDLRQGEDDSGLRTLLYTLQEGSARVQMKVWFDPKGWILRKRVLTIPAQNGKAPTNVTETYEPVVNSEVSDDVFKLTGK
jgi:outer membrane lipoprotein-sorting protein